MIIERQELLNITAELHKRIAELEAENKALRERAKKAETALAQHIKNEQFLRQQADNWEAKCGKLEAACAEMRAALVLWMHEDGCFCEASFSGPGCHPRHSDECQKSQHALSSNRGQPLLDRMRAMEEILNDLSHRSIHGFDHRIKSDCGCVSNCPACQWEALKKAKP